MKTHTILLILATLLLFCNTLPKIYFDEKGNKLFNGKNFDVLDIVILLNQNAADLSYTDPFAATLRNTIEHEEVIVASQSLLRITYDFLYSHKLNNKYEIINDKKKWLKFETKDKEFIVLIPKEKYPQITGLNTIELLGINKEGLRNLDDITNLNYTKTLSYNAAPIQHKTLLHVFTEDQKIIKRAYLGGHGTPSKEILSKTLGPIEIKKPDFINTEALIAQLEPSQYSELLAKLQKIGCSFLYVSSCYSGGWNALTCQTIGFYEQKKIFKKFEHITKEIDFIIVAESLPETPALGHTLGKISPFFASLHKFFETEKEAFISDISDIKKDLCPPTIKKIKNIAKITLPEAKEGGETYEKKVKKETEKRLKWAKILCNKKKEDITEIDAITGTLLTPIFGKPLSLIEKKPWLITSIAEILDLLRKTKPHMLALQNYSSIRFPGIPFFRVALEIQKLIEDLPLKLREKLERKKQEIKMFKEKTENTIKKLKHRKYELENNIEKFEKELEKNLTENQLNTVKEIKKTLYELRYTSAEQPIKYRLDQQIKKLEKDLPEEIGNTVLNFIDSTLEHIALSKEIFAKEKKLEHAPQITEFESMLASIVINYPFLIEHEIKREKNPIEIRYPIKNILIYPSIIDIPILVMNENIQIISMIPGRAQHYFKEIDLNKKMKLTDITNIFFNKKLKNLKNKLFFIKTIRGLLDREKPIENLILNNNIYMYQSDNQYFLGEKKIPTEQAKKKIKAWILQTTPAKEAIHDATAGIETIYKIRQKINESIPGLFEKKDLESKKAL